MNKILHNYRGLIFEIPELSGIGIGYIPKNINSKLDGIIGEELNSVWDVSRFNIKGRVPKIVGHCISDDDFSRHDSNVRILDLPIKFPRNPEVRIPCETYQWLPEIKSCLDHFYSINNQYNDYFAYLTIDQGHVQTNFSQRNGGLHVDGFQGARISIKKRINYSYIITDSDPTIFYNQKFDVSNLDEILHDFFHAFDSQKEESSKWSANPYDIILMNAYNVHASSFAKKDHDRTFFRLSFEERIFDRLGNCHNPLFDYSWDMIPRDVHSILIKND